MKYDAAIIGGGLAGCSAAIHLARRGHRVLLLEKQRYPVHKLCGEFLSVEAQDLFNRLGVLESVLRAGPHPIRHSRLTTASGATFEAALPGTALGLSRYTLDPLLFEEARAAGADARDGLAVRAVRGSMDEGFVVVAGDTAFEARLVLGAYGKRAALDRTLRRPFLQQRSPYVAFKAHFEGIRLPGLIELHAFPGGYCGLSHIEGEQVNVCWIARDEVLKQAGGRAEQMMAVTLRRNPLLARRLDGLRRVSEEFCAVGQVLFSPKEPFGQDVWMLGDTAGMIAPMCGDGMAMALRSAELAAPLASAFLQGALSAERLRRAYERRWRSEFGLRMWLGRWLHRGYCHPGLSAAGIHGCRLVPPVGRWLIRRTRGTPASR